ncbi:MAG: ATP-grasp domain-containing protein [Calditrichaeota bacterium]|nr:MAG: ATP-grasp domain-containing protein [Calditrichota bacterium]
MRKEFKRVAIVNRGEPAIRFIQAVKEYNQEKKCAIKTIAFYTEPDRNSIYVREADESHFLGQASYLDPQDGERRNTYLNYERLKTALLASQVDAVWVGWGFIAEHDEFAELCRDLSLTFIGPQPEAMSELGNKIKAKEWATKLEIPIIPWGGAPIYTVQEAEKQAEELHYPVIIKAAHGGGGRGIRTVYAKNELAEAFQSAKSEACKLFRNATLFMEKLLENTRHIEVQILADHYGTIWPLSLRDCSVQRRHQKVMEECPPIGLSKKLIEKLNKASVALGKAVDYRNTGTVEFLVDDKSEKFWFLEVNPRLQVEHPVTELTTNLDVVKSQIDISRGLKLSGEPPKATGHAIEVRLNAEDPANGFAPAPGTVKILHLPTGPGLRVDSGISENEIIPGEFDSMIAKIIAYGRTREEALARLRRGISQTSVIIRGGMSNKGFLQNLLAHKHIENAKAHVSWLDNVVEKGDFFNTQNVEVALLHAAIKAYQIEFEKEKTEFFVGAQGGRPLVRSQTGHTVKLIYQAESYQFDVFRMGPTCYRINIDHGQIWVDAVPVSDIEWRFKLGEKTYRVFLLSEEQSFLIEVNGSQHRISWDFNGMIKAPAPAVVISSLVKEGDTVRPGDKLFVLEAMKMETAVVAYSHGTVKEILVRNNMQVNPGDPLLSYVPEIEAGASENGRLSRIKFDFAQSISADISWRDACNHNLEASKNLFRGYDHDAAEIKNIGAERNRLLASPELDERHLEKCEIEILQLFMDIVTLFRRSPLAHESQTIDGIDDLEFAGDLRLGSKEYLYSYLRNMAERSETMPDSFRFKLIRTLAYYGITSLQPGQNLDLSLYRICKSHQRMPEQIIVLREILQRRLAFAESGQTDFSGKFQHILQQLVAESQNRFPTIYDLAHDVSYKCFGQPILQKVRQQIFENVDAQLGVLQDDPGEQNREKIIETLVKYPLPIHPALANWFKKSNGRMLANLLETITRRYYRIRDLQNQNIITDATDVFFTADFNQDDKKFHIISSCAQVDTFDQQLNKIAKNIKNLPAETKIVLELYVWKETTCDSIDDCALRIQELLEMADFSRPIHRVVVALTHPTPEYKQGFVQFFTFRQNENGFFEERLYRGFHPMIGKRLEVWRLGNFNIERLPSADNIYLFRAIARENTKDERLFAFAEVRDLTVVKSQDGSTVQLPEFEHVLHNALTGIRRYLSSLPPRKRLYWNRIIIDLWPPMDLPASVVNEIQQRLAPATIGLALEKIVVRAKIPAPVTGELRETILEFSNPANGGVVVRQCVPSTNKIRSMSDYARKVVSLRQRGIIYPYELIRMLTPEDGSASSQYPAGDFSEYDFDASGKLIPVQRDYGENTANIIVGILTNYTRKYPEGVKRVVLLGDPSKALGALAEPECTRINAGIDLAEKMQIPVEWYAISAGAKISMDSGTENMDWISKVLRRIINFTQRGGEINIIVTGINVGAQPYWNAEATMLMHTRGILIMMPESAMVLTGKQALEYSGGVAAEDNQGIGGYERVMGPNGQAQYFAKNIAEACNILLDYYNHTYRLPGERFPRNATTNDDFNRDVCEFPHGGDFERVGDVFSNKTNPGRKKPFDIRQVMRACKDMDHPHLERWFAMQDAEIAVVWDAHLGGQPVCMLGIESRPMARTGFVPADGPKQWTGGTLFPQASRKVARAINAASNNRPLVVIANLSGFDGSPESLRNWQLEYGAEIGRAVVNFKGPIVFTVVSRYHGGAFVVFSNALHDNMEVIALEGTYASVIGGAPAAAVVFAREVKKRVLEDQRMKEMDARLAKAETSEIAALKDLKEKTYQTVYSEKLGEVADEFDAVHSVQRAEKVGSVDKIIPPEQLRPYLIAAVERGVRKAVEQE